MRVVWAQGETTVGAVTEELHRRQARKRAYTTVMTVMGRLYERGLLHRERVGRHYVYRPAMDETALVEAMSERAVDELLERYGTTALRQFAHRLADLTPDLRAQLIDLAERRDRP